MSKSRITYIISLVILGVVLVFVFLRPIETAEKYSDVSRESLIQAENVWILQFDISNHEGEGKNYTIEVSVDGALSKVTVYIPEGGRYNYVRQINEEMLTEGAVTYTVFKEGESDPFEHGTYYIQANHEQTRMASYLVLSGL